MMGKSPRRYKWDPLATNGTRLETGSKDGCPIDSDANRGLSRTREGCSRRVISWYLAAARQNKYGRGKGRWQSGNSPIQMKCTNTWARKSGSVTGSRFHKIASTA